MLNGRTSGHSFGILTFHAKNGSSADDYIICDQQLIQTFENFIVKPPTYLCDHSHILTWIKMTQQNNPTRTDDTPQHLPFPKNSHHNLFGKITRQDCYSKKIEDQLIHRENLSN